MFSTSHSPYFYARKMMTVILKSSADIRISAKSRRKHQQHIKSHLSAG
ncbi:hypothetical protein CSC17_2173 [Klebsiella oxytoca]|nr:hypothetical protein CSC17_2173 [Klebsiella oxytoca]